MPSGEKGMQGRALSTGHDVRMASRSGGFAGHTTGLAHGFVQGNLAILPRDWAEDFLRFCTANPKACPLLGVSDPGSQLRLQPKTQSLAWGCERSGEHHLQGDETA